MPRSRRTRGFDPENLRPSRTSPKPLGYDPTVGDVDPAGLTDHSPGPDPGKEPARTAPPLVEGTQVDKYRLVRVIGSGGMGVVWAAHDPDLDREVALKVLRSVDAEQMLRTRLLREARAMARLKHPNVLTVYEVGTEYDRDYIAMELVEGGNLDTWLQTKPAYRERWQAVLGAGRGLAAAHEAGLVHRDFKPHNVLRSEEGRVMVTDFGLARGIAEAAESVSPATVSEEKPGEPEVTPGLEETLAASASSGSGSGGRKADPLLDSPLTMTGAMIGTPAYMSPEQLAGGFAGAKSDQFAFCVTAWQVLAGARPFRGDTLADLARAVLKGPQGVEADLPGAVRDVLERGLAQDPAKRWPDMHQLLIALERAGTRRQRRATYTLLAVGVAGLAALSMFAFRKEKPPPPPPPPPACPDAAVAIASAWSPELRAQLSTKLTSTGFAHAADQLDAFRGAWMTAYTRVCSAPADARFHARVACLHGVRDELAATTQLIGTLPPSAFDTVDMREAMPQLTECAADRPVTPPDLPTDPVKRKAIHDARAQLMSARLMPPTAGLGVITVVEAQLDAIGWKPLEAELYETAGVIAQHAGNHVSARRSLARAAKIAALARYFRVETRARVALVETALARAADPRDPDELKLLFEEAEDAIASAGGSRHLSAVLDGLRADSHAAQLRYDKAIDFGEKALAVAIELAEPRTASVVGAHLASYYAARDAPGDLAKARDTVVKAEKVAQTVGREVSPELDEIGAEVAWRMHELSEVHRRLDRARKREKETKTTWTGRVVDAQGAPVVGARVLVWSGELAADAERLYVGADGSIEATTDSTGGFTLVADDATAIAAELGDRRSPPIRLPAAPGKLLVVTVGPTHAIKGRIASDDDPLTGVTAEVILEVGDATMSVQAPVERDGAFEVRGIPAGPARIRATGAAGDGARRTVRGPALAGDQAVAMTWPVVQPVDVIVRGPSDVDIYVIAGKHAPENRAELMAAVDKAPTFALAATTGVGADTTHAGRQLYIPDDVHAIIEGVAVVSTACAITAEPDALPECKVVTPEVTKVTVRGGHHIASALAVLLEVGESIGAPSVMRDER